MKRGSRYCLALLAGCCVAAGAGPAAGQTQQSEPDDATRKWTQNDPRYGLLTPLPETGGVPPIVELLDGPTAAELTHRARAREYATQIRLIRRKYLGRKRVEAIRAVGIEQLREFTDPAAFRPLIEELAREDDDVRLAMLDHFAEQGDVGQAALAWVAIHDRDPAIRHEASRRMSTPVSGAVLALLDASLRSTKHSVANKAGMLAGTLGALETIPLLIFAQAASQTVSNSGDLAWIAIQTQTAYVQNLQPVVGSGAGAFEPVIATVSEGTILRVVDAVAIIYRTAVHNSLVSMTTEDLGQSTEYLAYNMPAWWEWYNTQYVPLKNDQARRAALADQDRSDQPASP